MFYVSVIKHLYEKGVCAQNTVLVSAFSSCSCSDSGLWLLSLLFMSVDLFLAESDKRIYAVTLTLFLAIFALRIDYLSQMICFSQHCGSEQGHKHSFLCQFQ